MCEFDSADMMTGRGCCFDDCFADSAPNLPYCDDCSDAVEMGDRGVCEHCDTAWISGWHHCQCWELRQQEHDDMRTQIDETYAFLRRWSR